MLVGGGTAIAVDGDRKPVSQMVLLIFLQLGYTQNY
jgi:hypothetical protein